MQPATARVHTGRLFAADSCIRVCAGLCCLALSACNSGHADQAARSSPPKPSSLNSRTTAPTVPSSTGLSPTALKPEPPRLPAVNEHDTASGARATAVYWLRALGYAFDTLDTTPMRAIAFSNCQACANYGDAIDDVADKHGRMTTLHPFRPVHATVERASKATASVLVTFRTGQSLIHIPREKDQTTDRSTTVRGKVFLTWTVHGWKVNDLSIAS